MEASIEDLLRLAPMRAVIVGVGFDQVGQAYNGTRFRLDASRKPLIESLAGMVRDRSLGLGFDFVVRLVGQSPVDQRLLVLFHVLVVKLLAVEDDIVEELLLTGLFFIRDVGLVRELDDAHATQDGFVGGELGKCSAAQEDRCAGEALHGWLVEHIVLGDVIDHDTATFLEMLHFSLLFRTKESTFVEK